MAQAPTAGAVIAQADVYDGDSRPGDALALLRMPIPGASPADQKKIQAKIAGVEFRWGLDLLPEGAAQAIPHFQASLDIERKLHEGDISTDLNFIADAYADTGQYEKAIGFYEQEQAIQDREKDDEALKIDVYSRMGHSYSSLGQYERAISFFQQSLSLWKRFGDKKGKMEALRDIDLAQKHVREHWVPDAGTVHEVPNPPSKRR